MARVDNTPFPHPLKADFIHPSPTIISTYRICHTAERFLLDHRPAKNKVAKEKLINIRLLGHLLSQSGFLSDRAIAEVARDILSCRGNPGGTDETDIEGLNKLGKFYRDYLLRTFRKFKGPLPTSSSHPGRSSFEDMREDIDKILKEVDGKYSPERKQTMEREDNRCRVTRILDRQFATVFRPLNGDSEVLRGIFMTLEFCHIFSESTNMNIGGEAGKKKREYSRNAWALLKSFGYTGIVNDLASGDKVHSLENVMMLISHLHDAFDRLRLWLEPLEGVCNRYRLCSVWDLGHGLIAGQEITFQSADPSLPLPNPEYLRLHAACCRVAHMSGAAGLFDEEDMEFDSDPTAEVPGHSKALQAHLEHPTLTFVATETH